MRPLRSRTLRKGDRMRKLVFGINVTIDGCCDHTKGIPDSEVHDYFKQELKDSGTLLYGRKTYELMVPFWPSVAKNPEGHSKDMVDFAQAFVSVPQIVVVSRSLKKVEDKNTSIIHSNLKEEILKLKQQPGKNISVGGVDLPSQLIELGLVDEIQLVVHPVVAGKGRRLFDSIDLHESLGFKLSQSKVFKSGCIALRYVKE